MGRFSPTVQPTAANPFAAALTAGVQGFTQARAQARQEQRQAADDRRTEEGFRAQMEAAAHARQQWALQDAVAAAQASAVGVSQTADGRVTTDASLTPGVVAAGERQRAAEQQALEHDYRTRQLAQQATIAQANDRTQLTVARERNAAGLAEARLRANTDRYLAGLRYPGAEPGSPQLDAVGQFKHLKPAQRQAQLRALAQQHVQAVAAEPVPAGQDPRAYRARRAVESAMSDPSAAPLFNYGLGSSHFNAAAQQYANSPAVARDARDEAKQARVRALLGGTAAAPAAAGAPAAPPPAATPQAAPAQQRTLTPADQQAAARDPAFRAWLARQGYNVGAG